MGLAVATLLGPGALPAVAFLVTPAFQVLTVEPGREVSLAFTLQGTKPRGTTRAVQDPVRLRLVEFEIDPEGALRFPVRDGWAHSARDWIRPREIERVNLTSEQTTRLEFSLRAPAGAVPGTYFCAVEIQPASVDDKSNVQVVPRAIVPVIVEVQGPSRGGILVSVADARADLVPARPPSAPAPATPRKDGRTGPDPGVSVGPPAAPAALHPRMRFRVRLDNRSTRGQYAEVRGQLRRAGRVQEVFALHPVGAHVPRLLSVVMPMGSRDFEGFARRRLAPGEHSLDLTVDLGVEGQFRTSLPVQVPEDPSEEVGLAPPSPVGIGETEIHLTARSTSIVTKRLDLTNLAYDAIGVRLESDVPWLSVQPTEIVALVPGATRQFRVRVVRPPLANDGTELVGRLRLVPSHGEPTSLLVRVRAEARDP